MRQFIYSDDLNPNKNFQLRLLEVLILIDKIKKTPEMFRDFFEKNKNQNNDFVKSKQLSKPKLSGLAANNRPSVDETAQIRAQTNASIERGTTGKNYGTQPTNSQKNAGPSIASQGSQNRKVNNVSSGNQTSSGESSNQILGGGLAHNQSGGSTGNIRATGGTDNNQEAAEGPSNQENVAPPTRIGLNYIVDNQVPEKNEVSKTQNDDCEPEPPPLKAGLLPLTPDEILNKVVNEKTIPPPVLKCSKYPKCPVDPYKRAEPYQHDPRCILFKPRKPSQIEIKIIDPNCSTANVCITAGSAIQTNTTSTSTTAKTVVSTSTTVQSAVSASPTIMSAGVSVASTSPSASVAPEPLYQLASCCDPMFTSSYLQSGTTSPYSSLPIPASKLYKILQNAAQNAQAAKAEENVRWVPRQYDPNNKLNNTEYQIQILKKLPDELCPDTSAKGEREKRLEEMKRTHHENCPYLKHEILKNEVRNKLEDPKNSYQLISFLVPAAPNLAAEQITRALEDNKIIGATTGNSTFQKAPNALNLSKPPPPKYISYWIPIEEGVVCTTGTNMVAYIAPGITTNNQNLASPVNNNSSNIITSSKVFNSKMMIEWKKENKKEAERDKTFKEKTINNADKNNKCNKAKESENLNLNINSNNKNIEKWTLEKKQHKKSGDSPLKQRVIPKDYLQPIPELPSNLRKRSNSNLDTNSVEFLYWKNDPSLSSENLKKKQKCLSSEHWAFECKVCKNINSPAIIPRKEPYKKNNRKKNFFKDRVQSSYIFKSPTKNSNQNNKNNTLKKSIKQNISQSHQKTNSGKQQTGNQGDQKSNSQQEKKKLSTSQQQNKAKQKQEKTTTAKQSKNTQEKHELPRKDFKTRSPSKKLSSPNQKKTPLTQLSSKQKTQSNETQNKIQKRSFSFPKPLLPKDQRSKNSKNDEKLATSRSSGVQNSTLKKINNPNVDLSNKKPKLLANKKNDPVPPAKNQILEKKNLFSPILKNKKNSPSVEKTNPSKVKEINSIAQDITQSLQKEQEKWKEEHNNQTQKLQQKMEALLEQQIIINNKLQSETATDISSNENTEVDDEQEEKTSTNQSSKEKIQKKHKRSFFKIKSHPIKKKISIKNLKSVKQVSKSNELSSKQNKLIQRQKIIENDLKKNKYEIQVIEKRMIEDKLKQNKLELNQVLAQHDFLQKQHQTLQTKRENLFKQQLQLQKEQQELVQKQMILNQKNKKENQIVIEIE